MKLRIRRSSYPQEGDWYSVQTGWHEWAGEYGKNWFYTLAMREWFLRWVFK